MTHNDVENYYRKCSEDLRAIEQREIELLDRKIEERKIEE
ncbi:MAG: hypothetical protein ACJAQR_000999 [Bacteroidia bacterium]|jgi:hypothetical protein